MPRSLLTLKPRSCLIEGWRVGFRSAHQRSELCRRSGGRWDVPLGERCPDCRRQPGSGRPCDLPAPRLPDRRFDSIPHFAWTRYPCRRIGCGAARIAPHATASSIQTWIPAGVRLACPRACSARPHLLRARSPREGEPHARATDATRERRRRRRQRRHYGSCAERLYNRVRPHSSLGYRPPAPVRYPDLVFRLPVTATMR